MDNVPDARMFTGNSFHSHGHMVVLLCQMPNFYSAFGAAAPCLFLQENYTQAIFLRINDISTTRYVIIILDKTPYQNNKSLKFRQNMKSLWEIYGSRKRYRCIKNNINMLLF